MKINGKSLFKKIVLALAGVAALTGIGFGVKAIVDYTKNDLKTISPSFEVGNLGSDGKYVDDESTLYTKDAFACYGLQVKPDFDSTVNYQIFYYDILDNYISSTDFMSEGYIDKVPINGAYARIVIEPRNDEDGKISFIERVKYSSQLTIKVKKNQDINNRYTVFKGKILDVVYDCNDLVFTNNLSLTTDTLEWHEDDTTCVTSLTVLNVSNNSTISFDSTKLSSEFSVAHCRIFEFKDMPSNENFLKVGEYLESKGSLILDKKTKYVLIYCTTPDSELHFSTADILKLPSCFSITKTK
ncbi:MAG: hypothetical protein NC131_17680 [Roseburia sp.]|nr:hypothetical protein [Roseburia sp.]